jgi:hypothetical protein
MVTQLGLLIPSGAKLDTPLQIEVEAAPKKLVIKSEAKNS